MIKNAKSNQRTLVRALIDGENSGSSEKTLDDIWKNVTNKYKEKKMSIATQISDIRLPI